MNHQVRYAPMCAMILTLAAFGSSCAQNPTSGTVPPGPDVAHDAACRQRKLLCTANDPGTGDRIPL
jgi:hypothetical protein